MQRQRCYTTRLHHCSHRLPSIDPGQVSGEVHRECKGRDTILQKGLHHCSHRPPSIDPGSGQQRWHRELQRQKKKMPNTWSSTIAAQPPSIDQGRSAERWQRECKGRDTMLWRLHHCSHRPPSIDPGSGHAEVPQRCKGRGMSARRCTG